jgi:uncharacterized protein
MLKGMFAHISAWKQFIIVLFLLLFAFFFSSTLFYLFASIAGVSHTYSVDLGWLRFLQAFQSFMVFIVVPCLAGWMFSHNVRSYYVLRVPPVGQMMWVVVLMVSLIPIVNISMQLNKLVVFPESLQSLYNWMVQLEKQATDVLQFFFSDTSFLGLVLSLFIIAVIPSIGEELVFRGLLQKIFTQWTKNAHVGIWISAFLFSFIHFQFFGFLPRMLLGAFFGYLFLWSGNLMIPIFAHFVNNAIGVTMYWLYYRNSIDINIDTVGINEHSIIITVFSIILVSLLFYFSPFRKKNPVA